MKCRWWDSNPHGFPNDFESFASAIPPHRLIFNSFAPVCALQTGAFCLLKNFFKKFLRTFGVSQKSQYYPAKRGTPPTFHSRKEVIMWNLIAGSFKNNVLFKDTVTRYCTMKRATLIESFVHIRQRKIGRAHV